MTDSSPGRPFTVTFILPILQVLQSWRLIYILKSSIRRPMLAVSSSHSLLLLVGCVLALVIISAILFVFLSCRRVSSSGCWPLGRDFFTATLQGGWGEHKIFRASPEGRTGVSSYTGEGRHLGGIIGIPWPGSEAGLGVHVATIRSFFVVCAAIVAAVGAAAGCLSLSCFVFSLPVSLLIPAPRGPSEK